MTISARPDVRADGSIAWFFRIRVTNPDGTVTQKKITCDTEADANVQIAKLTIGRSPGGKPYVVPDHKRTVADVAAAWLEMKRANEEKRSTIAYYEDILRTVLERHGNLPVQKLTASHLNKLKADMRSGALRKIGTKGQPLSKRSVNGALVAIGGMLEFALEQDWVGRNVATKTAVPRFKKDRAVRAAAIARRGTWELKHANQFLASVEDERLAACWWLTMLGMRRGEVLGLRWEDIDLDAATITIVNNRTSVRGVVDDGTTKSGASDRTLHNVPAGAVERLRALRDVQRIEAGYHGVAYSPSPYVAVDAVGRPLRPAGYSDAFTRLVKAAGLPDITLHGARWCAASVLASAGYPLVTVAAWLGQSQESVAAGYVVASEVHNKAAGATLSGLLGGHS